jgi:ATP-dependent DNA helicase RecG
MEETYGYLQLCNQNRSVIDGLTRTDYWDYSKDALREALVNALIHRDYGFSGSIIINVNDKEIEFVSLGGLLPGLMQEDIRNGISQLRNRYLAEAFHRLNLIEAYGTGIRRIYALYAGCVVQPVISITPNSFKITLPNMNQARALNVSTPKVTTQMQQVLDILSQDETATEAKLGEMLGVKRTRMYNLLKQMELEGLIRISGRGANKRFLL